MIKFYIFLLGMGLLASSLMVGCGGDNDENSKELEGVQRDQTNTPAPVVENTEEDTPMISDAPAGTIMFLSQEILYRWDLNEEIPEVIASDVSEDNMIVSPSSEYIFYVVREDGAAVLYKVDTATGQTERILELGRLRGRIELQWQIGNWSPDEKWAVLTSFDFNLAPTLISIDNTSEPVMVSQNPVNTLWLEDGRIAAYEQNFQNFQGDFAPIVSLIIVDPSKGERIQPEWADDVNDIESFDMFLSLLDENGLNVAFSTFEQGPRRPNNAQIDFSRDGFSTGQGQFCAEVSISQDADSGQGREVIFERDDVFTLLNLQVVADQSLIFMQIQYPDCTLGVPVGEVIRLDPGQEPVVLSNQLTSQLDQNGYNDRFFDVNQRLDVSPDMSHVVWIETTPQGNQSSLVIWDVAANEMIPVSFDIPEFRPRRVFWFE